MKKKVVSILLCAAMGMTALAGCGNSSGSGSAASEPAAAVQEESRESTEEAAARELWEETGISAQPQHFIRMHQWIAPDKTPFLRFLFAIELEQICPTQPHDSDIDCCRWVSAEEILQASNLRSPLVAESIRCYQSGQRYPLEMIGDFNWPFTKGVI